MPELLDVRNTRIQKSQFNCVGMSGTKFDDANLSGTDFRNINSAGSTFDDVSHLFYANRYPNTFAWERRKCRTNCLPVSSDRSFLPFHRSGSQTESPLKGTQSAKA